jgi:hypothetical protein
MVKIKESRAIYFSKNQNQKLIYNKQFPPI